MWGIFVEGVIILLNYIQCSFEKLMFWICIYLLFREGSCHATDATLISTECQNRSYDERSSVLPLSPPEVLFRPLFPQHFFFFIQNSKLSHRRAILFYESFPPRKVSFLSDMWEYYSCHKTKDNKTCLTSYISGSVERGSDEKLVSIKHRSFSCFLIWRSYR